MRRPRRRAPGPRTRADLAAGRFDPPCPRCGAPLAWAPIDEDAPLDPRNVYAATKLHQEHLCAALRPRARRHRHRPPLPQRLRPPDAAGHARTPGWRRSSGRPWPGARRRRVYEDGRQTRDFVHVRDVARANVAALTAPRPVPGPLNVASGHAAHGARPGRGRVRRHRARPRRGRRRAPRRRAPRGGQPRAGGRPAGLPGGGAVHASGSRTVNRHPPASLRTAMSPSWASTSPRAMARPRPAPPVAPGERARVAPVGEVEHAVEVGGRGCRRSRRAPTPRPRRRRGRTSTIDGPARSACGGWRCRAGCRRPGPARGRSRRPGRRRGAIGDRGPAARPDPDALGLGHRGAPTPPPRTPARRAGPARRSGASASAWMRDSSNRSSTRRASRSASVTSWQVVAVDLGAGRPRCRRRAPRPSPGCRRSACAGRG